MILRLSDLRLRQLWAIVVNIVVMPSLMSYRLSSEPNRREPLRVYLFHIYCRGTFLIRISGCCIKTARNVCWACLSFFPNLFYRHIKRCYI